MASVTDALVQLRAKAQLHATSQLETKQKALALLQAQQNAAGHTPSGPRRKSDGVEDEQQGIVSAETSAGGGALLRVTLLAAGYVIGPAGASVREVSRATGADIRSWSESFQDPSAGSSAPPRRVRTIVIEGKRQSVVYALNIIASAVDRYVHLTGGSFCGQSVDRAHVIDGCTFFYSPPPRAAVPFAAALRSTEGGVTSPADLKSPSFPSSPTDAADKENAMRGSNSGGGAPVHAATATRLLLSPPFSPARRQQGRRLQSLGTVPRRAASTGAASHERELQLLTALQAAPEAGMASMAGAAGTAEGMEVDGVEGVQEQAQAQQQQEALTPAYRTYSLFGDCAFGSGGSVLQQNPFAAGGSSLFSEAFEATPTPPASMPGIDSFFGSGTLPPLSAGALLPPEPSSSAFLAASTPIGPVSTPLLATPSMHGNPHLSAVGEPGYAPYPPFAPQTASFQSQMWDARAPSPAPLQPQPSGMASGTLAQLPLGLAVQSWQQQGSLFGHF